MNEDLRQSMLRVRDYLSGWPRSVQGVAIVLSAAVAILAMVLTQADTTEPSHEPLFSQLLTPSERQEIEAALGEAELHDYVLRNGRLHVPAGQRSRYAAAISEANCLPDSFYDPMEDAIRNSSIIDLGPRLAARMHHALEKKAGLAIRGLHGVTDAFVNFDETKPRGFQAEREVTAVVGVKTTSERSLNAVTLRAIHDMVLHFKAGLRSSQLTVIDLNTGWSFNGSSLALGNDATTRVIEQRILEGQLHERLSPFLSFVPDVRLAVHVQLPLDNAVVEQSIVRVSVGIPTSYLDHVREARQRHARSNAGESLLTLTQVEQQIRNKIQSAIRPLLPGAPTEDEVKDQVVVTAFEDPATPATTRAENSWFHMFANTSWPVVVVPTLTVGLVAMFLLRAHRHSLNHPPQLTVVTDTEGERDQATEVVGADTDDAAAREQLQTLVEEDPEAAARSLSEWMSRAS